MTVASGRPKQELGRVRSMMRTTPDWLHQSMWFIAGIFGTGAVWYFLSQRAHHAAFWSAVGAGVFASVAVALSIRNKSLERGRVPTAVLHVKRDKRFDSGWITPAKPDDLELALRDKSYMVTIEFRSRWWVTNQSTRPAQLADAYFKCVGANSDRETCEFCFVSPDGRRVPPGEFQNTAHVEVNLWSSSERVGKDHSLAGYIVIVDHIGNEYKTEPLIYCRTSLEEFRGSASP
jgi:hypothetical protein